MSSGGSALSLLDPSILPENVNLTVSVLDEHYVADPNERNFEKLKKTEFFRVATKQPPSSQIRTPPVYDYFTLLRGIDPYGGTVEEAGKRFDLVLKNWMSENPDGKIVCTVGMGADGHTAGIPAIPSIAKRILEDQSSLVTYYDDESGVYGARITMTFLALSQLDLILILVLGQEKREALKLMFDSGPIEEIPARFYLKPEIAGKTILVTDQVV